MATIAFDVTAETKAMVQKIQQLETQVGRLQGKLSETGKGGASSFGKTADSVTRLIGTMVGVAGVTGAVMQVVSSVKNAYRQMLEEHQKFVNKTKETSGSMAAYLFNAQMSGFLGGDKKALDAFAKKAAAGAGVELKDMYAILTEAVSAGGDASPAAIKSAAILAGSAQRIGLGQGAELAGGALDVRSITGMDDATKNMAFLASVGAASRATTLQSQLQLLPGMQALKLSGDSAEQAGELAAALNIAMKDAEGSKTKTALINMATRLEREALAPTEGVDPRTGKRSLKWGKLEGESTTERLSNLQAIYADADKQTREDILERFGRHKDLAAVLPAILGGEGWWSETMTSTQGKITAPGSETAGGRWGQYWQSMSSDREGVVSAAAFGRSAVEDDKVIGREREVAKTEARNLVQQWQKQQGFMGTLGVMAENVMGFGQMGLAGSYQPEYWARRLEESTPDEKKDTERYKILMASLLDLQRQHDIQLLKEAGLGGLSSAIDRMSNAAERLADAQSRRSSQDVD
ncbi:MAG: hypothetical protein WC977_01360 [Anaerovoracaceae bacterium]